MATSYLTDRRPTALPNRQEFAKARAQLSAVCKSLVDLQWRANRIGREAQLDDQPEFAESALVDGDEIPTFAHIGELHMFTVDARSRLEEATSYLDALEAAIVNLDTVREMHEGNDA